MALQTPPVTYRHPGVTGLFPGLPEKGDQRQCWHTYKQGEPKTNTRTDKRLPTTQCWVFGPPESSCPPELGSPSRMASTAHQTRVQELSFPRSRLPSSALAGLGLAPAGASSPFPPIESFLRARYLPASQQGLGFTLGFPVPPELRCYIYPSPLSWKCSLPWSRDPRRAPRCYARCLNPRAGREKASKTMKHTKREVYC